MLEFQDHSCLPLIYVEVSAPSSSNMRIQFHFSDIHLRHIIAFFSLWFLNPAVPHVLPGRHYINPMKNSKMRNFCAIWDEGIKKWLGLREPHVSLAPSPGTCFMPLCLRYQRVWDCSRQVISDRQIEVQSVRDEEGASLNNDENGDEGKMWQVGPVTKHTIQAEQQEHFCCKRRGDRSHRSSDTY